MSCIFVFNISESLRDLQKETISFVKYILFDIIEQRGGKCQNKDTIPRTFHAFDSHFSNKKNIVEMKCALRESVKV